jgi:hypothetical protein
VLLSANSLKRPTTPKDLVLRRSTNFLLRKGTHRLQAVERHGRLKLIARGWHRGLRYNVVSDNPKRITEAQPHLNSAARWRTIHDKFMELEANQKHVRSAQDCLEAYCSFADSPELVDTSAFPPEPQFLGDCCQLPTLESAKLELSEGPGEHLKVEFEALATTAGKVLGCPKDVQPLRFWLYCLFMQLRTLHLRGTRSRHLFAPIQTARFGTLTLERAGGIIHDVCEASAMFSCVTSSICSRTS